MLASKALIEMLKQEVQPAVGCTEPGAVALAVALAAGHCSGELVSVKVLLSPGVYKNGYAVGTPGTGGDRGILIAVALGALSKDASKGLAILQDLEPGQVNRAKELVRQGMILAAYDWDLDGIHIEVCLRTSEDVCRVVVRGGHTQVESIELNGNIVFLSESERERVNKQICLRAYGLKALLDKAALFPPEELDFLLEGLEQNILIAEAGLDSKVGLGVGFGIKSLMEEKVIDGGLINRARSMVAAAADARMEGVGLPVSTSFGSGNQGLLTSLAIGVAGEHLQRNREDLARALAMGHLVNGYVKESTGKISPMCGCAVAAGLGITAAVSWLLDNDWLATVGAMNNLLGNVTGMVCDGAKGGCAFKLATSAGEALLAAFLAKNGIYIQQPEGMVAKNIDDTITNLGLIGQAGMANLDRTMLDLITDQKSVI